MTKILNLDKLSKQPERQLTINGTNHPVLPISVENFIETSRTVESMVKEGASLADQVSATVDMICRTVPTAPREVLVRYDLETLHTIASFVRGEDVAEQEQTEAAAAEAGK
jgi:hypothetical protein